MDEKTIRRLAALNDTFYRTCADSFFATRQNSWPGWKRCLDAIASDCRAAASDRGATSFDCGATSDVSSFDAVTAQALLAADSTSRANLSLVDLACGNLRFEAFLAAELDAADIPYDMTVHAIDTHACTPNELLAHPDDASPHGRMTVSFKQLDLIGMLIDPDLPADNGVLESGSPCDLSASLGSESPGDLLASLGLGSPCDLSVSFGFMHHIPSATLRVRFLATMLDLTRRGGYVAVSLWRFVSDEGLADRARKTTAQALDELAARDPDASLSLASQLEEGDMLLGWGGAPGRYRYCHDFTGGDVDVLIDAVSRRGCPVARFLSDGRNGELNEYIVLRRT